MKIISLAPTVWTERWMNRQQLMSRLARRSTVLYSNASWYSWDRHHLDWQRASWMGGFELRDNVWVESVPKWMVRNPRLHRVDSSITRLHAARWRKWIDNRGEGPLILHMFHPAYVDYIPYVRADAVVYQPYDWFEFMPGWTPQLETAERKLLALADAVITPSESFSEGLEKKANRSVRVVLNGVDIDLFANAVAAGAPAPDDLAAIPGPRIGYIGWLETHVDLALIAALADRRPEWNFVFVGGQTPNADERLERELKQCKSRPNIHFLGPRQRHEVPAYMLNMDVNTICWRLEEGSWAGVGYPLKLQEYMACGRSVVSADLHSVRTLLNHVVTIARNIDEWEAAIAEAISTGGPGSPDARRAIALQNSWDKRTEQLESILNEVADVGYRSTDPVSAQLRARAGP